MSVRNALAFIQYVHDHPEVKTELHCCGTLSDLVSLAAQKGYAFTAEAYRMAFVKDWQMRRRRFGASKKGL